MDKAETIGLYVTLLLLIVLDNSIGEFPIIPLDTRSVIDITKLHFQALKSSTSIIVAPKFRKNLILRISAVLI